MRMYLFVARPVTIGEMATIFETTAPRIDRIVRSHNIRPSFRAGRTRLFGPRQVRLIYESLQA
jgi:hypothetical protein